MSNLAINEITKMKEEEKKKMDDFAQQVRDFVDEYGYKDCDYINYRKSGELCHRNAYNVLNRLQQRIEGGC